MWYRLRVCRKGSSDMGRGGGGGGGNRGVTAPIKSSRLPAIQGSEKQIAWAENIRRNAREQFDDFAYAANKVLSGKGDQPVNTTGEKRYVQNGNMFPNYKKYLDSLGVKMVKFFGPGKLQGPTGHDKIRDALRRMRNNFATQTDARYWIDRR